MKVLVTGSFGNVGQSTLRELLNQDKRVICFDIKNKKNKRIARKFARKYPTQVDIFWGDLTKIESIRKVFADFPNIGYVIHIAAIIPPLAYQNKQLAYKVNVEGTENLVRAMEEQEKPPSLLFTSSVAVYGNRLNSNLIRLTDELKPNPEDNYAESKILAENIIKRSTLKYRIFRLSFITSLSLKPDPLMFNVPLNTSIEILDTNDAGFALANATNKPIVTSGVFHLAGGKENRTTYREFLNNMMRSFGFDENPFPDDAFARDNFSCGFMVTDGSQKLFNYQRITLQKYYNQVRKKFRFPRFFIRLFKPIIKPIFIRSLIKNSPFYITTKNPLQKPKAVKTILPNPTFDYKNKIFVVTGATSGIGKAIVLDLIKKGAEVAAIARSAKKFNKLYNEMREQEFTDEQLSNLTFFEADLSVMDQILDVSSQIETTYPEIDVLINNVGGYFSERRITKDGFELTFGLNYLGQVLLTRALLNKLNNGSESNIITISSSEHKAGKIHYGNLQLERRFFGKTAYAQSKLAGMMFVREISEYLDGCNIHVNAIHPGIVKTNIAQEDFSLQSIIFRILKHTVAIDTSKAVDRILAILENPKFKEITGEFISKDKIGKPHKLVKNKEERLKLWNATERLLEPWLRLKSKEVIKPLLQVDYCE